MYSFMLNAEPLSLSEKFFEGGKVLLIGMCTVFAVLCIIWFCLYLTRLLLARITSSGEKAPAPAPAVAPAPAPVAAPVPTSANGELIAVIAAAIAAAEAECGHSGFRVVSFHRVNK
ncbi:MAG: OadG family protein [Clostridia bacterium]|nr:OadG family protein [Clostridia bacterium]